MKYLKLFSFFLVAALLLAGCQMTRPLLADDIPYDIELSADGLNVPGVGQQISFGRAEAGTIAAVTKLLSTPPQSRATNDECGIGSVTTVSWMEGLNLLFQNGNFQGWSSDAQIFIATNGFSAGMTRTQIRDAGVTEFDITTLGTEFEFHGMFGLIKEAGPAAPVDLIWAGVSCFFR